MRGALNKIDGVAEIKTDTGARTCSFMVPKDVDVAAKLTEVSKGNTHLAGYTITAGADSGSAKKPEDSDKKTEDQDSKADDDAKADDAKADDAKADDAKADDAKTKADDGSKDKADDQSATNIEDANLTLVSLKVPNMH